MLLGLTDQRRPDVGIATVPLWAREFGRRAAFGADGTGESLAGIGALSEVSNLYRSPARTGA